MLRAKVKFNSGMGAILCSICNRIIKTGAEFTVEESKFAKGEGHLDPQYCDKCIPYKYVIQRHHDGLTKRGNEVFWIEWKVDGYRNCRHNEPAIGRSLILNPNIEGGDYTWMTTAITQIISMEPTNIVFQTMNSIYTLTINDTL
jgi:hypothetical protein